MAVRSRAPAAAAAGLALVLLGGVACGTEREVTGGGDDGPRVTVVTLTIHVRLQPSDAGLASALGWVDGVPGARVNVLKSGTDEWIRLTTDAAGRARAVDLLPGLYRVYAGRFLTPGEAEEEEIPIRSFGDGVTIQVAARGEPSVELELSSDSPGSLVISEIGDWTPPPWELGEGSYFEAEYFEVYNNSERTRFLDGMIFGATVRGQESIGGWCAHSQAVRADSLGVYAFQMVAFPGRGGEYPIGPGETRLVAIAAIDHTAVHPELPDLSHADFEVRGAFSADNPAVPDMIDVGLEPFVHVLGLTPLGWWKIGFFLARPFDPGALPIMYRDLGGRDNVRVPRDLLLDVAGRASVYPDLERERPACVPLLHRDFDRYEGGFLSTAVGGESRRRLSFQRRVLRSEGGRDILSNSNTSAVDFVLADLTPGVQPWP